MLRLSARFTGRGSRLGTLHQAGALKALLPRGAGEALEAVTLNTAGGLTGGDRMRIAAEAEPDARLVVSTQAAERAYGTTGDEPARVETKLRLGAGARLDWLPQETILYDRADLRRRITVEMASDATLILAEPLVFGRAAMGERCRAARLRDRWEIRRGGRLVFADALRLEGDIDRHLQAAGVAGGCRAMAGLLCVSPGAEARIAELRELLPAPSGVSLIRDGVLSTRILAEDGYLLRKRLAPAIEALTAAPLPKVWRL